MAGLNMSAHGRRPNRLCSFPHPSTQPGTVDELIPAAAIFLTPLLLTNSMLMALGAQPLALRAYNFRVFASQYETIRSPPTPFIIGSTTPITAFAAMAASTAEPPCSNIFAPAAEASV